MLLVCAALLARTVIQLRTEPLGFIVNGVAVAEVDVSDDTIRFERSAQLRFTELEERLLARPGVRAVAAATAPPLTGGGVVTVRLTCR